jgi:carbon storage regulator
MLVLARRVGQEIVIGDNVQIVVLEVRGNQVRLGITAPPALRVDRQEVRARQQLAAQKALQEEALAIPCGA